MNEHPIAKVCPRCGSAAFKRVRVEKGIIAFTDDRSCRECGTRYTPPTPAWAAVLFIAVGGFILAAYLGCIIVAIVRSLPFWKAFAYGVIGSFTFVPISSVCIRYGLRKLKPPKVGPPDDGGSANS